VDGKTYPIIRAAVLGLDAVYNIITFSYAYCYQKEKSRRIYAGTTEGNKNLSIKEVKLKYIRLLLIFTSVNSMHNKIKILAH
jgi:hypothetical protein